MALCLLSPTNFASGQQTPTVFTPSAGMVIDRAVRIRPGVYRLKASGDAPGITIRGENIAVDFTGVTIEGAEPFADPDSYIGTGILIDGGSRVTVIGATIRGYKVGLHARRSPHLRLANNDLSYNWKQRLWSGIEKESLVDWMSYHNNEKDEWLRYGAAIYLSECDDARIENNRAAQGQNGLMITRSARARIWNNTFSWLSAIGIGLYRTIDSIIQHNRIDWAVRGYSHGFYHRGQDSAAILMYEQSSRNTVAYNSATHGGDGLFLWAGQSTMDTGQGGANDNLFYGNDFSHAVANGIEATFSRNKFIANRVDDCWRGVWGGYSYDSTFVQNSFAANTEAIAIEHGQNITIHSNTFKGDETAIRVWANPSQDPNWGYPKHRDTRSRDYVIQANRFDGHKTVLNVLRTSGVRFGANTYANVGSLLQAGADVKALELEPLVAPPVLLENAAPARLDGAIDARLPEGARRGRSTIIVDEWGPYDYKSPKVWPAGKITDRPMILRVLGPPGRWSLQSIRGGTTTSRSGSVPGELKVVPAGPGVDLNVALEYVGEETTSPRGKTIAAGRPVPVPYSLFDPAVDWHVKFWRFDAASDPLDAATAFQAKLKEPPVKSESVARLSYLSSRALSQGLPNDRVALRADGAITLPPGRFEMAVISDDGVRVWVDDRIVVDRWTVHESTVDRAPLTGGRHRLRVEYFERTGWAELQVRFLRVRS